MNPSCKPFSLFIEKTISPHHTSLHLQQELQKAGFTLLDEKKPWSLKAEGKYIITRGCTTTCVILPKKKPNKAHIIASHLDTPALKLRPNPIFFKEGIAFFRTEVYGGPNLNSLMNRKLNLAGAIYEKNSCHLVQAKGQHFFLPTCPIHLEKKTNTNPPPVEKHNQLAVPIGDQIEGLDEKDFLKHVFKTSFDSKLPLAFDLYFTIDQTPYTMDSDGVKLVAPRLDNSASVFAALESVKEVCPLESTMIMAPFFHHEEVGSSSDQGADSELLPSLIARLLSHFEMSLDEIEVLKRNSSILSLDNAHAFWPLDSDKYDKHNTPVLGKGPAIKATSSMRYATSPELMAQIKACAHEHKIPLQTSVPHNNYPAGSTLGPFLARATGIATLDIGIAQCSMHAAEELIDIRDLEALTKLIKSYLASKI